MNEWLPELALGVVGVAAAWWGKRRLDAATASKTGAEERQIEVATYKELQDQVRVLWKERSVQEDRNRELVRCLEAERAGRRSCEEMLEAIETRHAREMVALKGRITKLENRLRDAGLPPNGG